MRLEDVKNGARKIESYYNVYENHFSQIRERKIRILEIGVQGGGSLQMWRDYFPNSEVVGLDVCSYIPGVFGPRITTIQGDQADTDLLKTLTGFDIIIDDGGHTMKQQQTSFDILFPLLNGGGIYVIEDLHTSFYRDFKDIDTLTTNMIADLMVQVNMSAFDTPRGDKNMKPAKDLSISEIHSYPSITLIYKK